MSVNFLLFFWAIINLDRFEFLFKKITKWKQNKAKQNECPAIILGIL